MHADRFVRSGESAAHTLRWRIGPADRARSATLVDRCPTGVSFLTSADDTPALGEVVHTAEGLNQDAAPTTRALVRRVVRLPGNLALVAATFAEAFGAQQLLKAA